MGKPVKIVDLARQMIELSGLRADDDIQIEFIGIRPGEKLFEEITHSGENFSNTTHPKIFRFNSRPGDLAELGATLQTLQANLHEAGPDQFKRLLQKAVPDYSPYLEDAGPKAAQEG
jgi:FlaA1/EpsC-like NDP-sugar epimerase